MAENIEFIPANELPEATGNEVSVLCLENGELKQKSGASLGGGNTDYDMVIHVVMKLNDMGYDETDFENTKMISGSFDAVKQKIYDGGFPSVLLIVDGITTIWLQDDSRVVLNERENHLGEMVSCVSDSRTGKEYIYINDYILIDENNNVTKLS